MLTVGSIMTRDPLAVTAEHPIERALWLMRERRFSHLPVTERGRLVGVLSERDLWEIRERRTPRSSGPRAVLARDCMSVSVETVAPDEPVTAAARRLAERRVGCLPVVAAGRLVGLASQTDFLRLHVRACRAAGRPAALDPTVARSMSTEVIVVDPDETVGAAFELCRAKGVRHLPVVRDGWLVGVVSDRDLGPLVARSLGDLRKVGETMTKDFVAISPDAALSEAAQRMLAEGFHALPVLRGGALKGIVTSTDVLRQLAAADEATLEKAWSDEAVLSASRLEEC